MKKDAFAAALEDLLAPVGEAQVPKAVEERSLAGALSAFTRRVGWRDDSPVMVPADPTMVPACF